MNDIQSHPWPIHLNQCEICRKAARWRFVHFPGGSNKQIHAACCEIGQPLYKAFCDLCEDQAAQDLLQKWNSVVDVDPQWCGGKPVLKGTRFTISQVLAQLAAGDSVESLGDDLSLNPDHIRQVLECLSAFLAQPMES